MNDFKIPLRDIPADGKSILLENPAIWQGPIEEFKMDCQIVEPVTVQCFLLPIQNGCLVKGTIKGKVVLACHRCTENVTITIDDTFETFENSPEDDGDLDEDVDNDKGLIIHDESRILLDNDIPVLDLGAIFWEEFLVSLPIKPLCQSTCKGLCAKCGANLNQAKCNCSDNEGDPRFAILRDYKVKNKN